MLTPITNGSAGQNVPQNFPGQTTPAQPVLQAQDNAFVATVLTSTGAYMVSFDQSGNPTKTVLGNYQPLMATADGGVIAQSNDTGAVVVFDATGKATGQMAHLPTQSWTNNAYQIGTIEQVPPAAINLATTFAALLGGNASGQGTAIQQVQTNQAQGDQKQLPDLSEPGLCLTLAVPITCGNINAIELLTNKSPDFIFQTYIQTFAPVIGNNNSEMSFVGSSSPINVTGVGQKLTIALKGFSSFVQKPFSVLTERFDPTNHVISAVTLQGHPLAGWRYWRVYSIATNDIVIETGAYDQPGDTGLKNYVGYYLSQAKVSSGWQEYLQFIQKQIQAPQGSRLNNALGGINLRTYPFPDGSLLEGYWDYDGDFTNYILNIVCQSTSCN